MSMILAATALMLQPAPAPDLDWLAGYWLSCAGGREVSETWSNQRMVHMLGSTVTVDADGASSFEHMRIAFSFSGPSWEVHFIAQPFGQQPVSFRLVRTAVSEAVFENLEHDFPQRVIYRRSGHRLSARIEGTGGRSAEWEFRAAPHNARCPAA